MFAPITRLGLCVLTLFVAMLLGAPTARAGQAPRRVAVVMVHWDTPDDLSPSEVETLMFGDQDSTRALFREMSFGKTLVSGDVFGWYEVDYDGGCDWPEIDGVADLAMQAFVADGNDPSAYDHFMFYFPKREECRYGGLAEVGQRGGEADRSWYNGQFTCKTRAQELAHNLGMRHSGSQSCTDADGEPAADGGSCEVDDYGNPFGPLGRGCGHVNAYQKAFMGWIDDVGVVTADVDGVYNLSLLELPCEGTQALRIPVGDAYYYLEYRQAVGADAQFGEGFGGVLVNLAPGHETARGQEPVLLDMTAGSLDDNDARDGFLRAGDGYGDPEGRVYFEVLAESETHATIRVRHHDGRPDPIRGGPKNLAGATVPEFEGAYGAVSCAAGPVLQDPALPEPRIVTPALGTTQFDGVDVRVTGSLSDDRFPVHAALELDGTRYPAPGSGDLEWDLRGLAEGRYRLALVVSDGFAERSSEPVELVVRSGRVLAREVAAGGDGTGGGAEDEVPAFKDEAALGCSIDPRAPVRFPLSAVLLLPLLARRRSSSGWR